MKLGVILLTLVVGTLVGYRVGLWWLHRNVQSPELESAVYPVLGAIIGALVGVIVAALVAWKWRTR